MTKLYCIAEFKAKLGREDDLFNSLQLLEKETSNEEGCEFYKVMKKVDNECATGEHMGMIVNEVWTSHETFIKHNNSKHITDFFQKECLDKNGSAEKWNVNVFE
jgi:quinol monooxygenase YgiN